MISKEIRFVEHDGCILVMTPIDHDLYSCLLKRFQNPVLNDYDLARLTGATLAFGHKKAIARLKEKTIREKRKEHEADLAETGLSPEAVEWLLTGQHSKITDWFFWKTTGIKPSTPEPLKEAEQILTSWEFRQCLQLCETIPEVKAGINRLSDLSPVWKRVMRHWSTLIQALESDEEYVADEKIHDVILDRASAWQQA